MTIRKSIDRAAGAADDEETSVMFTYRLPRTRY